MRIGSVQWEAMLRECAAKNDVYLNKQQLTQLTGHVHALLRWSAKTNLTTIKEPKAIIAKHIIDSLAAVKLIPSNVRLLDIGSGGGYPGIPLKIARPDISVTLIDASRKKVTFLKHVIRSIELAHIDAKHIRIEELAADAKFMGCYHVCVSRAVGKIAHLVAASIPLLSMPGIILFYQGRLTEVLEEFRGQLSEDIRSRVKTVKTHPYQLPYGNAQRHLLYLSIGEK
jgi:16S rRNA (guanine527-N7)-methyltransferase